MTFCLGFSNQLLKLHSRKELQQLAKYATKSIHQWPSFICGIFGDIQFTTDYRKGLFFSKVILDKTDLK